MSGDAYPCSSKAPSYAQACSIGYEEGRGTLPWVSCIGEWIRADDMVRIAKRYGIPVIEDAPLAQALSKLAFDEDIPKELFEPVAVILATLSSSS